MATIETEDQDVRTGETTLLQCLEPIRFQVDRETKGAVRFAEMNADGNRISDVRDSVIGTLYMRKPHWEELSRPYEIVVTVGVERS